MVERNPNYKEILKLKKMLKKEKIPYEFHEWFDGYQIGYPVLKPLNERVCSVIETKHSYGHDEDLLEIMGLLTEEESKDDSVLGHLTAENVFNRIKAHYDANKE